MKMEKFEQIGFEDVELDYYWTSNIYGPNNRAVRAVHTPDDFSTPIISRDDLCFIWPVRTLN